MKRKDGKAPRVSLSRSHRLQSVYAAAVAWASDMRVIYQLAHHRKEDSPAAALYRAVAEAKGWKT